MNEAEDRALLVALAAAFGLAADFGLHESVANHFSAAVSADGKQFLLTPRWRHFSAMRATELLRLDPDDSSTMQRADVPDPSAWCIHGNLYKCVAHVRILLHCHLPQTPALAALADQRFIPFVRTRRVSLIASRLIQVSMGSRTMLRKGNGLPRASEIDM